MCCVRLPILPSLAIAKTKGIAATLSIFCSNFNDSWQWLDRFRTRQGLQKMLLHREGAEVNKNDSGLLSTLERLSLSTILRTCTTWTRHDFFWFAFKILYSSAELVFFNHWS